jgi:hypothetical protein
MKSETTLVLQEVLKNLKDDQKQITCWTTHLKNICLWSGLFGIYPSLKSAIFRALRPDIDYVGSSEGLLMLPILGTEIYGFFNSIFKSRDVKRNIGIVQKLLYVSDGMNPKDKQSILMTILE